LMSEAGLSWKTARPEFYKSDERAQEASVHHKAG